MVKFFIFKTKIPQTLRFCGTFVLTDYFVPRTVRELQLEYSYIPSQFDYFVPRTVRELQHFFDNCKDAINYFVPRTVRELQPNMIFTSNAGDYFVPRTVRELQLVKAVDAYVAIISYQELLGSYNKQRLFFCCMSIISYQELLGSYNLIGVFTPKSVNYFVPRTVRELQQCKSRIVMFYYYFVPRTVKISTYEDDDR